MIIRFQDISYLIKFLFRIQHAEKQIETILQDVPTWSFSKIHTIKIYISLYFLLMYFLERILEFIFYFKLDLLF